MNVTATHINYFNLCHRKLWLFANGINMEHNSDIVYDGALLHETSYPQRANMYSEIELSATYNGIELHGKIDFYNHKEKVIHETKRGNAVKQAHEWQVKFYIWLLELNDIEGVSGKIEYPKLRKTSDVYLTEPDREYLKQSVKDIQMLIMSDHCPSKIESKICKKCSYYELCYVDEME